MLSRRSRRHFNAAALVGGGIVISTRASAATTTGHRGARGDARRRWLASTALCVSLLIATGFAASSALAAGGAGGAGSQGGAGGVGGAAGSSGGAGGSPGGGGGGGGAGGGAGGNGDGGIAGGSGGGGNGSNGGGGSGGGGGAGGFNGNGMGAATISIGGSTGGAGGTGGFGGTNGGGGGGGAGGFGAIVTGNGGSNETLGAITGGAGGNGGSAGVGGVHGGGGGDGGVGLQFTGSSSMFANLDGITGGNGGMGGGGSSSNGTPGQGGAGIVGAGLTIINSGTIAGGFGNGGAGPQADAIIFTGGANSIGGGGSISGGIAVQGGSFAPALAASVIGGQTLSIGGPLTFASGTQFVIRVSPNASDSATVTGTATLGGASVNAIFANGTYVARQYTILSATGGVAGIFGSVVNTNLPANFSDSLSYGPTQAFLNLTLNFAPPGSGLTGNQQAVGNAIASFFNTTGSLPLAFGGLTSAGLTQVSGETAVGSQQTTFDAMGQFMGVMTDPFMNRGGGVNGSSSATGYTEENAYAASSKTSDAFAMFTKAPPTFEQRWSVWASGFGGSQSTSGNAAAGTNNTTSNIVATAVGADYLISPNTIAGFALAGGGTSFSVANGGTGRSDLFQMGAYVRHTSGPAYIAAALAYGWQDITTNRTVTAAGSDQLRAQFNANAWSGRLEGGYRFVSPATFGIGITPYAAAQFVTFDLPAYAEQAIVGTNNFALNYGAKDVTDARTELGIRTDKSFAMPDGVLTLRGRAAWAYDYDPDRSIGATFQSLPGASFTVNGAAQAANSALTTASIEMKWKNGWSAGATFEGEFSNVTSSYAGKGVLRYAW